MKDIWGKSSGKKDDIYVIYFSLRFFFLMWTIFKVFIEFVTILLLLFMFLFFFGWEAGGSLAPDQPDPPLGIERLSLNHLTATEGPNAILDKLYCLLGSRFYT